MNLPLHEWTLGKGSVIGPVALATGVAQEMIENHIQESVKPDGLVAGFLSTDVRTGQEVFLELRRPVMVDDLVGDPDEELAPAPLAKPRFPWSRLREPAWWRRLFR